MSTGFTPHGVLALEIDGEGAHPAAWRVSGRPPAAALTGQRTLSAALTAESAGFHAVTIADTRLLPDDGPAHLDAVQRAAYVAPHTRSLGLVPEIDVVFTEPFHLATQLASLDYVSAGRAGWIITAHNETAAGAAVGRSPLPGAELPAEAADVVEVNRRLWDSWEDEAVTREVATGRYLDREKVHHVDFEGRRFSVKGPSIIPRPLQGQLPVWAPAALVNTEDGLGLDGIHGADAVLVTAPDPVALLEVTRRRADDGGAVIAELEVALDARGRTGADRVAELDAALGTVPDASLDAAGRPGDQGASGRARYVGHATGLAELLAELLRVAGGVRLHPLVLDVDLHELGQLVLPALRHTGRLAPTGPDTLFRSTLGLPAAGNRFATA